MNDPDDAFHFSCGPRLADLLAFTPIASVVVLLAVACEAAPAAAGGVGLAAGLVAVRLLHRLVPDHRTARRPRRRLTSR